MPQSQKSSSELSSELSGSGPARLCAAFRIELRILFFFAFADSFPLPFPLFGIFFLFCGAEVVEQGRIGSGSERTGVAVVGSSRVLVGETPPVCLVVVSISCLVSSFGFG